MAWFYYSEGREQKEELRRKIARSGSLKPMLVPQGSRKLAATFWGRAWCDHLESHRDYEYRLPRGRSYLRQGNVYNLNIEAGSITASVAGSSLYDVRITIKALAPDAWKRIKRDCAGKVASLLDLLGRKLGEGVLRAISDAERGLFPKPSEIKLVCSCPDSANMCKHVAAVLYGVGVLLDASPELFFILRSLDPSELLSGAAKETLEGAQAADSALAGEDLGALFGISMDTPAEAPSAARSSRIRNKKTKPSAKKTPAAKVKEPRKKLSAKSARKS